MADESSRQVGANPEGESHTSSAARFAGFVTAMIKVVGLAIAANEALFTKPPRDAVVFGVAAFMMAGAQGIDSLLEALVGRK